MWLIYIETLNNKKKMHLLFLFHVYISHIGCIVSDFRSCCLEPYVDLKYNTSFNPPKPSSINLIFSNTQDKIFTPARSDGYFWWAHKNKKHHSFQMLQSNCWCYSRKCQWAFGDELVLNIFIGTEQTHNYWVWFHTYVYDLFKIKYVLICHNTHTTRPFWHS